MFYKQVLRNPALQDYCPFFLFSPSSQLSHLCTFCKLWKMAPLPQHDLCSLQHDCCPPAHVLVMPSMEEKHPTHIIPILQAAECFLLCAGEQSGEMQLGPPALPCSPNVPSAAQPVLATQSDWFCWLVPCPRGKDRAWAELSVGRCSRQLHVLFAWRALMACTAPSGHSTHALYWFEGNLFPWLVHHINKMEDRAAEFAKVFV